MLAGASTVFFAYTGFDSVTSTAEEVCTTHPENSCLCVVTDYHHYVHKSK